MTKLHLTIKIVEINKSKTHNEANMQLTNGGILDVKLTKLILMVDLILHTMRVPAKICGMVPIACRQSRRLQTSFKYRWC